MRQKFCTACGALLSEGIKFCESCGTPVDPEIPALSLQPPASVGQEQNIPPTIYSPPASRDTGKIPVKIIAGIFIVLIIAAVVVLIVVPKMSIGSSPISTGLPPSSGTASITPSLPKTTMTATPAPTPTPDPFPNALLLKEGFLFGEDKIASEGTVYRIWINETYYWHNDMDNKYYLQKPKPGYKYLFLFINVFNKGDTRIWPPTSGNICL